MAGAFDDIPITRAPVPTEPPTWGEWARDLFTGERRTEFPLAQEFSRAVTSRDLDTLGAINRSAITPDPQAQIDILRRNIPGLEVQRDAHQNIMLRATSIGVNDWTYLNRPGASWRDLDEVGTQFLATLPFGAAVGLGRTVAQRAVIGGGALAGGSVAQDVAATALGSEQGVDPTRAAVAGGVGTVAGPVAGWLAGRAARAPTPLAVQRADELAEDVAAHRSLDVRPFGPGFGSAPIAGLARQLADTPVIGAPTRRALEESVSETARAAQNIAGRFGTAATADDAGLVAREALDRFRDARPDDVVQRAVQGYTQAQRAAIIAAPVRDTSLKTKQAALYEQAWSRIPEEMQLGRAVEGLPRVLGQMATTRTVLDDIASRNTRMINASAAGADDAARPIAGAGFLSQVIAAVRNPSWRAALQTMRDIRSDFRRLASKTADSEANTLRLSDIERVQSAVTRDMIALLERNVDRYAGLGRAQVAANIRRAITEFRRADQFTRTAAQRMETIERLFNAENATALYRNIAQAALGGTRGDVNKLRVLGKTLRRDEMNEVASYVIRAMGEPVASARGFIQEIGFSPSSFMTRLNNMQPEAREIIFGRSHVQALNDLARVANRLANVEAWVNTSRSGTNVVNLGGLLGGGGAIGSAMTGAGGLESILGAAVLGGGVSILFSRPSYVRWVQGYAQLRAAVRQAPQRFGPALTAHVARLESMAVADPALLPVVRGIRAADPDDERHGRDPGNTH